MIGSQTRRWKSVLLCGVGLGLLAFGSPALSQTPPALAADHEGPLEEVVVTGTRVVRNGYDAPTPTTVVGADTLQRRSPASLVDALVTLPAFRASFTSGTGGAGVSSNGGQSFINLRTLGANRTLVLFNNERVVPTTAIATVDVAIFPSQLIQRVDVVTGGASAAWGSDAVAGVVNIVLDTKFTGFRGDLQGGVSSRGDNKSGKLALAYGADVGERGHFLLSAEYLQSDGVKPRSRPWMKSPSKDLIPNPAFVAGNGQTQFLLLPNVYYLATLGGVIVSGPLRGTQFNPGGSTSPYTFCEIVTATQQACVNPRENQSSNPYVSWAATPQTIGNTYGRFSYDLTDNLNVHADAMYGYSSTSQYSTAPSSLTQGFYTIRNDNAYLSPAVKASMAAAGVTSFALGRTSDSDIGPAILRRKNATQRYTIGADAVVWGDWKLKAYAEYGHNRNDFRVENNVIRAKFTQAVDAVVNPANGAIVCRSTLTAPNDGCKPLNLLGIGAPSAAAIGYVMGTSQSKLDVEQRAASVSLAGEPFDLWAGPVSLVVGAEFRKEEARQVSDAQSMARLFILSNPQPLKGDYSVKEAFAETVVPLARNLPFVDSLDLNAAIRLTDYSTSGSVVTWKAGLTYNVTPELKLRATRSRDIRAPNILELFSSSTQATAILIDPRNNASSTVQSFTTGSATVDPEKADTTAAGAIYTPSWLPGFRASVDYYRIEIRDAISTLPLQDILNRCQAGNAELCTLITRSASGALATVTSPFLNLQSVKTEGLDVEASYAFDLDKVAGDLPGNLELRALGTHVIKYDVSDGITVSRRAGSLFWAEPDWVWDLSATYRNGPFSTMLNVQYDAGGPWDDFYAGRINDNSVKSHTVVNANFQYETTKLFVDRAVLYLIVNNIFDVGPPAEFHFAAAAQGNMAYDRTGRGFKAGVRFNF